MTIIFKKNNPFKAKLSSSNINEILWVTVGQVLTVVLNFVIIRLLSKMGVSEYGKYALVLTIISLLGLIFFGPFTQGFIRFYYHYKRINLINTYNSVMNRFVGYSLITLFIIVLSATLLNQVFNISDATTFLIAAGLYIIFFKTDEFYSNSLNIVRRRKENSLLQGLEKLIIILVLVYFLHYKELWLNVVLTTMALIAVLFSLIKFYLYRKISTDKEVSDASNEHFIRKEIIHTLFKYASPFLIWGIAGWIQLNSEKWIINKFLSISDVGIYAIMMSLVNAMVIIPNTIISDFSMPIIFDNFSNPDDKAKTTSGYQYIKIIIFVVVIVTIFSSIITLFFGKTLIILISSSSYAIYSDLLPILCIGTGFFYIGQALCNIGLALNQPQRYIMPKIVTGLITVTLNIIFIINFGIKGIAFTVLTVGIIYSIFIYFINKKILIGFSKLI